MKKMLVVSLALNISGIVCFFWAVQRLGGFQYLQYLYRYRDKTAWYLQRKSVFEALPVDSNDIIFLGNSITAQGEWAELTGNPNVKNRGISGDVISRVRERLPAITEGKPAQIFLLIGVNDLLFSTHRKVADEYQMLVQEIRTNTPGTELYLQSVLPVNNQIRQTHVRNEDIVILNGFIDEISKKNGTTFVNIHSVFCDREGQLNAAYTYDGIHLNGAAYWQWVNFLKSNNFIKD